MSTISKLDKSNKLSKSRRLEALGFFLAQAKLSGAPGIIAATIYADLLAIHRASELSGEDKEYEFTRYLHRARASGALVDASTPAAGVPEQSESDRVGELPASDELPAE